MTLFLTGASTTGVAAAVSAAMIALLNPGVAWAQTFGGDTSMLGATLGSTASQIEAVLKGSAPNLTTTPISDKLSSGSYSEDDIYRVAIDLAAKPATSGSNDAQTGNEYLLSPNVIFLTERPGGVDHPVFAFERKV